MACIEKEKDVPQETSFEDLLVQVCDIHPKTWQEEASIGKIRVEVDMPTPLFMLLKEFGIYNEEPFSETVITELILSVQNRVRAHIRMHALQQALGL